jgi:predicted nucleic acid-binding protein
MIDAERGIVPAIDFLTALHRSSVTQLSAISAMELIQGCRNQNELQNVVKSLSNTVIHELSPADSRQARDWLARFSLNHGLRLADALIAATAYNLGISLYTKNVRHFAMLPGLSVMRPY